MYMSVMDSQQPDMLFVRDSSWLIGLQALQTETAALGEWSGLAYVVVILRNK